MLEKEVKTHTTTTLESELTSGIVPHPKGFHNNAIEFARAQNTIILIDPGIGIEFV